MNTEFLDKEPQAWEFRSKPIWQRVIVLSAGVIMNLVLAIAIFWGVIYHQGRTVYPITEVGYVLAKSPASKAGILHGDKIVAVNGKPVSYWEEIESSIYAENLGSDITLSVQRQGQTVQIFVKASAIPDISEERFGILPAGVVPVVGAVEKGKPAESIGLQVRDTILAVDGEPVAYAALPELIHRHASQEITLTWKTGATVHEAKVIPTAEGRIGISLIPAYKGPMQHLNYSFFEAFPAGATEVVRMSGFFLNNLWQLVTGKASFSKSVGGPVKIAQMANQSAEGGLYSFLVFVALLSISLAFFNILPFPALDGGHLLFLTYEGIFRREIPVKVKIGIQQTGIFLLLAFMAVVLYNDIANL